MSQIIYDVVVEKRNNPHEIQIQLPRKETLKNRRQLSL